MASDPKITDEQYRQAAHEKLLYTYNIDDNDVDVDDADDAVSRLDEKGGGDNGAWVRCWLWVRNEDARSEEDENPDA